MAWFICGKPRFFANDSAKILRGIPRGIFAIRRQDQTSSTNTLWIFVGKGRFFRTPPEAERRAGAVATTTQKNRNFCAGKKMGDFFLEGVYSSPDRQRIHGA
ncbi:hypothetical protein [Desulfovibrio sp. SGI.169]|uniref:hypothetical protein n=1 Tax=Desulfovibrio sp. SGI.169 TaxID=3420561 RepID=UPI003D077434